MMTRKAVDTFHLYTITFNQYVAATTNKAGLMEKSTGAVQEEFNEVLSEIGLKIYRFDPTKSRSVTISTGGSLSVSSFGERIKSSLGARLIDYKEVFRAVLDQTKLEKVILEHAKSSGTLKESKKERPPVPEQWSGLQLNLDESNTGRDLKFFMTTPQDTISTVAGNVYLKVCGIPENEAALTARKVVPEYRPRAKRGVFTEVADTGDEINVLNTYLPPSWMSYEGEVPDRLPKVFEALVNHLFPLKIEREFFFHWLHGSLFGRAMTYLILCGTGGTGKNRLKLVMRALHGHRNTVDGKRSTLRDKFNSQLADSTLAWFDELSYDSDMENVMKEVQNDSISIERKGKDATRSTRIYASLVVSNNKPRDNHILFDARKFVPLQIADTRLDSVMTKKEMDILTNSVENWSSPLFDVKFIAQIGRWVQKHGKSNRPEWAQYEYKGPMFYKLAHTSMTRWQKKAATVMLLQDGLSSSKVVYDKKRGYLWSTVAEATQKKHGDKSLQFPDPSTVKSFFDIFVGAKGEKVFETTLISEGAMYDFYVKLLVPKFKVHHEGEMADAGEDEIKSAGDEEFYDL